jgi:hypothetical protein
MLFPLNIQHKIISYFLMPLNRTSTFHTSIDSDGNPDQEGFTVTSIEVWKVEVRLSGIRK